MIDDKIKVLVVDDHELIRSGVIRVIEGDESLVVCAEAGSVDEAILQVERYEPHIVIADLSMGSRNGFELIAYLKNRKRPIPVLVVSMHDERSYIEKAMKAGAQGYVLKRDSNRTLATAIHRIMNNKRYLSEAASDAYFSDFCEQKTECTIEPKEVLSTREFEVFNLLGCRNDRKTITDQLNISEKTVSTHIDRIKEKLQFNSSKKLEYFAITYTNYS